MVLALKTRLQSEFQKLFTDTNGQIRIEPPNSKNERLKIAADLDVWLNDVTLALPPGLGQAGVAIPDRRITRDKPLREVASLDGNGKGLEESGVDLTYKVHVRTKRPAEVLADISPKPIPFAVDVVLNSSEVPVQGEVRLGDFPMDVLGIEQTFRGGRVAVRLSEIQQGAQGSFSLGESEGGPVQMSFEDLIGLTSLDLDPQQSVPIGQTALAFLTGKPIDIVVTDITQPLPQPGRLQSPTSGPEFRYRF